MVSPSIRKTAFNALDTPLSGTNLIEASAGTGKTHTITCLFLRLILEKRLTVKDILVVTYTVAATEELRDRIRTKIRDALEAFSRPDSKDEFMQGLIHKTTDQKDAIRLLRDALNDFDESSIFTIHGFCQRALHENAFESGSLFDTRLEPGQTAGIIEEIVRDFWRLHFYTAPIEFVSYADSKKIDLKYFTALLNNGRSHLEIAIIPEVRCPEDIDPKPFRALLKALQDTWRAEKAVIEEKMKDKGLSGHYTRYVPGYMEMMDDFVDGKLPPFPPPPNFVKFSTAELKNKTKSGSKTPEHSFFSICDAVQEAATALQAKMDTKLLFLKNEIFRWSEQALPAWKQKSNIQFFDDLLIGLRDSLAQNGDELAEMLRKRYKAVLIDEFQDTDPVQYAIFHNVFGNGKPILFLIGDPKQAIYSFRGADLFAYLQAAGRVNSRYTLTSNWRSEPELITAVNTIFSNRADPFLYQNIPFTDAERGRGKPYEKLTIDDVSESPFHLWLVDGKHAGKGGFINKGDATKVIARAVAGEISRLIHLGRTGKARIGQENLKEEHIAVLTRKNWEAQLMQEALSTLQIPSVLYSTGDLFETDEAAEMNRVLEGMANPNRESLIRQALATQLIGKSGEEIERLQHDQIGWEAILNDFHDYYEKWNRFGFMSMFRNFMLKQQVRSRLLSLPNGERRLTNVLHLSEVLHQAALEEKLGMPGLLKWLASRRDSKSPKLEEHQLRLESDAAAVKIVTIHKSKGLEYPIVFCPFNWDGSKIDAKKGFTFHDPDDPRKLNLVINAEDNTARALAEKEELAENLRILYVSLTRAKNRCYLVWGKINDAETSSMAYILHPPPDHTADVGGENHFLKLDNASIRQELETLAGKSRGTIVLEDMPADSGEEVPALETESMALSCRTFTGTISRDWKIASFSGLTAKTGDRPAIPAPAAMDIPDHDQVAVQDEPAPDTDAASIFAFPKGARAGSFLHEIFEVLDFTNTDESGTIVAGKLQEHGFEKQWEQTIAGMITRVVNALLGPADGLALSRVGMADRLSELEFHFSLQPTTPEMLSAVFAAHGINNCSTQFPGHIGKLAFSPVRGFMKGYIDLVFQFKERFYLIDWKSNHLGNRVEDYTRERMAQEMEERFYLLQSNLYALALHQYLKKRLPGYRYRDHFGGVFYIFLRGVSPNPEDQFGIYRDLPGEELLEALSRELIVEPGK